MSNDRHLIRVCPGFFLVIGFWASHLPPVAHAASADEMHAALDAFTGEWEGEMRVHAIDGFLLRTLHAERIYTWDGASQRVVTRFTDGDVTYESVAQQAVQLGRLQATVTRTGAPPEEFTGAVTDGGIAWTNSERNSRDYRDHIGNRGDSRTLEATSFEILRLKGISGLVRLVFNLEGKSPPSVAGASSAAEIAALASRAALLESELAAARSATSTEAGRAAEVARERDDLRAQVDAARADAGKLLDAVRILEGERDQLTRALDGARRREAQVPEIAALQVELAATTKQLANVTSSAAAGQRNNETLVARIDQLETERRALESRLAESEQAAGTAAKERERAEQNRAVLEKQLEDARAELARAKAATDAAAKQAAENLADHDALAARDSEIGELRKRLEQTTRDADTLARAAEKTRADNDELAARLTALQAKTDELSGRAARVEELARQLAASESARTSLVAENEKLAERIKAAESGLTQLRSGAGAESVRLQQLERDLAAAVTQRQTHEKELMELRTRLEQTTRDAEVLARAAETSRHEKETIAAEQQKLVEQHNASESELARLRTAAGAETSRIEQLERDLAAAVAARNARERELASFRTNITSANNRVSDLSAAVRQAEAATTEATSRATQLQRDNEALLRRNEEAKAGAARLTARVAELEQSTAAAEQAKQQTLATAETGEREQARLRDQAAALEKQLGEVRAVTETLRRERDELASRVSALEKRPAFDAAALEEERRTAQAQFERTEGARLEAVARVAELERLAASAEQARQQVIASAGAGEREQTALRERVTALEKQLDESQTVSATLRRERDELVTRVTALEKRPALDAAALEEERRTAQVRMERAEGARLDAIGRVAELEQQLTAAQAAKPAEDVLANLQSQLDRARRDGEVAMRQTDTLRAERDRFALQLGERDQQLAAAQTDAERARALASDALAAATDELSQVRTALDTERSRAAEHQKDGETLAARIADLEAQLARAARPTPAVTTAAPPPASAAAEELRTRIDRLDRRMLELESERNAARDAAAVLEQQLADAKQLRDDTLARFQDVVSQLNAVRQERERLARTNTALEAEVRAARATAARASGSPAPQGPVQAPAAPASGGATAPAEPRAEASGGMLSRFLSSISGGEQPQPADDTRAIETLIGGLEIAGVTATGPEQKVILNGRVFRTGEIVDNALGVTFDRVEGDALVFKDRRGREFRRKF